MQHRSGLIAASMLALVFLLAMPQRARSDAPAENCLPPSYALRAIRGAQHVDLVRLGSQTDDGVTPLEVDPSRFVGYQREEARSLSDDSREAVLHLLSAARLGCPGPGVGPKPLYAVGFDVTGANGSVRVVLVMPSGRAWFELPNGLRVASSLNEAGTREWRRVVATISAGQGVAPELLERDLARDSGPPPGRVLADTIAPASSNPALHPVVPDVPAEPITKAAPVYPDIAREAGVDGTVFVSVLVGKDGSAHDIRVVKSIPMLDRAAIESVSQWRFSPGQRRGAPVDSWLDLPVKFSLH